jgi:hypothetical protein
MKSCLFLYIVIWFGDNGLGAVRDKSSADVLEFTPFDESVVGKMPRLMLSWAVPFAIYRL